MAGLMFGAHSYVTSFASVLHSEQNRLQSGAGLNNLFRFIGETVIKNRRNCSK